MSALKVMLLRSMQLYLRAGLNGRMASVTMTVVSGWLRCICVILKRVISSSLSVLPVRHLRKGGLQFPSLMMKAGSTWLSGLVRMILVKSLTLAMKRSSLWLQSRVTSLISLVRK